jgi:molybdopterin-guanine dinucleotide biosynthesis protein A
MNQDKSWLEIDRVPMIERVAAAARPVVERLGIVVNAANQQLERYQELAESRDAKLIFDLHEHRGPLGGIHTALTHCDAGDSALILACDLPFITTEFLFLLSEIHQGSNPQSVTVPLDRSNRLQPLAAIYDQSLEAAVEHMLSSNELKVDRLYSRVSSHQLNFIEFAHLPGAERFFANINTPEEWRNVLHSNDT